MSTDMQLRLLSLAETCAKLAKHPIATPGAVLDEFGRATFAEHCACLEDFTAKLNAELDQLYAQIAKECGLEYSDVASAGCEDLIFDIRRQAQRYSNAA